jgi:hypothetical protein
MALRVSSDGTNDKGIHTIDDLTAFLQSCRDLKMPGHAELSGKTKLLGSGPLKTITAEWTGAVPTQAPADPVTPARAPAPLVPGLADPPTRPMPAVPADPPPQP